MNRIFDVIYNAAKGMFVVVSELGNKVKKNEKSGDAKKSAPTSIIKDTVLHLHRTHVCAAVLGAITVPAASMSHAADSASVTRNGKAVHLTAEIESSVYTLNMASDLLIRNLLAASRFSSGRTVDNGASQLVPDDSATAVVKPPLGVVTPSLDVSSALNKAFSPLLWDLADQTVYVESGNVVLTSEVDGIQQGWSDLIETGTHGSTGETATIGQILSQTDNEAALGDVTVTVTWNDGTVEEPVKIESLENVRPTFKTELISVSFKDQTIQEGMSSAEVYDNNQFSTAYQYDPNSASFIIYQASDTYDQNGNRLYRGQYLDKNFFVTQGADSQLTVKVGALDQSSDWYNKSTNQFSAVLKASNKDNDGTKNKSAAFQVKEGGLLNYASQTVVTLAGTLDSVGSTDVNLNQSHTVVKFNGFEYTYNTHTYVWALQNAEGEALLDEEGNAITYELTLDYYQEVDSRYDSALQQAQAEAQVKAEELGALLVETKTENSETLEVNDIASLQAYNTWLINQLGLRTESGILDETWYNSQIGLAFIKGTETFSVDFTGDVNRLPEGDSTLSGSASTQTVAFIHVADSDSAAVIQSGAKIGMTGSSLASVVRVDGDAVKADADGSYSIVKPQLTIENGAQILVGGYYSWAVNMHGGSAVNQGEILMGTADGFSSTSNSQATHLESGAYFLNDATGVIRVGSSGGTQTQVAVITGGSVFENKGYIDFMVGNYSGKNTVTGVSVSGEGSKFLASGGVFSLGGTPKLFGETWFEGFSAESAPWGQRPDTNATNSVIVSTADITGISVTNGALFKSETDSDQHYAWFVLGDNVRGTSLITVDGKGSHADLNKGTIIYLTSDKVSGSVKQNIGVEVKNGATVSMQGQTIAVRGQNNIGVKLVDYTAQSASQMQEGSIWHQYSLNTPNTLVVSEPTSEGAQVGEIYVFGGETTNADGSALAVVPNYGVWVEGSNAGYVQNGEITLIGHYAVGVVIREGAQAIVQSGDLVNFGSPQGTITLDSSNQIGYLIYGKGSKLYDATSADDTAKKIVNTKSSVLYRVDTGATLDLEEGDFYVTAEDASVVVVTGVTKAGEAATLTMGSRADSKLNFTVGSLQEDGTYGALDGATVIKIQGGGHAVIKSDMTVNINGFESSLAVVDGYYYDVDPTIAPQQVWIDNHETLLKSYSKLSGDQLKGGAVGYIVKNLGVLEHYGDIELSSDDDSATGVLLMGGTLKNMADDDGSGRLISVKGTAVEVRGDGNTTGTSALENYGIIQADGNEGSVYSAAVKLTQGASLTVDVNDDAIGSGIYRAKGGASIFLIQDSDADSSQLELNNATLTVWRDEDGNALAWSGDAVRNFESAQAVVISGSSIEIMSGVGVRSEKIAFGDALTTITVQDGGTALAQGKLAVASDSDTGEAAHIVMEATDADMNLSNVVIDLVKGGTGLSTWSTGNVTFAGEISAVKTDSENAVGIAVEADSTVQSLTVGGKIAIEQGIAISVADRKITALEMTKDASLSASENGVLLSAARSEVDSVKVGGTLSADGATAIDLTSATIGLLQVLQGKLSADKALLLTDAVINGNVSVSSGSSSADGSKVVLEIDADSEINATTVAIEASGLTFNGVNGRFVNRGTITAKNDEGTAKAIVAEGQTQSLVLDNYGSVSGGITIANAIDATIVGHAVNLYKTESSVTSHVDTVSLDDGDDIVRLVNHSVANWLFDAIDMKGGTDTVILDNSLYTENTETNTLVSVERILVTNNSTYLVKSGNGSDYGLGDATDDQVLNADDTYLGLDATGKYVVGISEEAGNFTNDLRIASVQLDSDGQTYIKSQKSGVGQIVVSGFEDNSKEADTFLLEQSQSQFNFSANSAASTGTDFAGSFTMQGGVTVLLAGDNTKALAQSELIVSATTSDKTVNQAVLVVKESSTVADDQNQLTWADYQNVRKLTMDGGALFFGKDAGITVGTTTDGLWTDSMAKIVVCESLDFTGGGTVNVVVTGDYKDTEWETPKSLSLMEQDEGYASVQLAYVNNSNAKKVYGTASDLSLYIWHYDADGKLAIWGGSQEEKVSELTNKNSTVVVAVGHYGYTLDSHDLGYTYADGSVGQGSDNGLYVVKALKHIELLAASELMLLTGKVNDTAGEGQELHAWLYGKGGFVFDGNGASGSDVAHIVNSLNSFSGEVLVASGTLYTARNALGNSELNQKSYSWMFDTDGNVLTVYENGEVLYSYETAVGQTTAAQGSNVIAGRYTRLVTVKDGGVWQFDTSGDNSSAVFQAIGSIDLQFGGQINIGNKSLAITGFNSGYSADDDKFVNSTVAGMIVGATAAKVIQKEGTVTVTADQNQYKGGWLLEQGATLVTSVQNAFGTYLQSNYGTDDQFSTAIPTLVIDVKADGTADWTADVFQLQGYVQSASASNLLNIDVADINDKYFAFSSSQANKTFYGTLLLNHAAFNLEYNAEHTQALSKATLQMNADSIVHVTTVADADYGQKFNAWTLNGGRLHFDAVNLGQQSAETLENGRTSFATVTDLDITALTQVEIDLSGQVSSTRNILSQDDDSAATWLIAANGSVSGNVENLKLVEIDNQTMAVVQGGQTVAQAVYEIGDLNLVSEGDTKGLNLGFRLIEIQMVEGVVADALHGVYGQQLVLDASGADTTKNPYSAELHAHITGSQGTIVVSGGAAVTINSFIDADGKVIVNDFTAAVLVKDNSTLIAGDNSVLGHANAVRVQDGGVLDLGATTQVIGSLLIDSDGHVISAETGGQLQLTDGLSYTKQANSDYHMTTVIGQIGVAGDNAAVFELVNSAAGLGDADIILSNAQNALTLKDIAESPATADQTFTNTVSGEGQLTFVNATVTVSGNTSGLTADHVYTIDEESNVTFTAESLLAAGSFELAGQMTLNRTVLADGSYSQGMTADGYTLVNQFAGNGALTVDLGQTSEVFNLGLDSLTAQGFSGSLMLKNATLNLTADLEDNNHHELKGVCLNIGQGGLVDVEILEDGKQHEVGSLAFAGGTLQYQSVSLGTVNTTAVVKAADTLDLSGSGTVTLTLTKDALAHNPSAEVFDGKFDQHHLLDQDDGNGLIWLATGTSVIGNGKNLNMMLVDEQGQQLVADATESYFDLYQAGDKVGQGIYDYELTVRTDKGAEGLYLAYGLVKVNVDENKTLTLTSSGESDASREFRAQIEGKGNVLITDSEREIILSQMNHNYNAYYGTTTVTEGTKVLLNTDYAFGHTADLIVETGALITATELTSSLGDATVQLVQSLHFAEGSTLVLNAGTELTLYAEKSGGDKASEFKGTLIGSGMIVVGAVDSLLSYDNGVKDELTIYGAQTQFTGDVFVNSGDSVIADSIDSLGVSGILTINTNGLVDIVMEDVTAQSGVQNFKKILIDKGTIQFTTQGGTVALTAKNIDDDVFSGTVSLVNTGLVLDKDHESKSTDQNNYILQQAALALKSASTLTINTSVSAGQQIGSLLTDGHNTLVFESVELGQTRADNSAFLTVGELALTGAGTTTVVINTEADAFASASKASVLVQDDGTEYTQLISAGAVTAVNTTFNVIWNGAEADGTLKGLGVYSDADRTAFAAHGVYAVDRDAVTEVGDKKGLLVGYRLKELVMDVEGAVMAMQGQGKTGEAADFKAHITGDQGTIEIADGTVTFKQTADQASDGSVWYNDYTAKTVIRQDAVLVAADDYVLGHSSEVTVEDYGQLNLSTSSQTIGALKVEGANGLTSSESAAILTLTANSGYTKAANSGFVTAVKLDGSNVADTLTFTMYNDAHGLGTATVELTENTVLKLSGIQNGQHHLVNTVSGEGLMLVTDESYVTVTGDTSGLVGDRAYEVVGNSELHFDKAALLSQSEIRIGEADDTNHRLNPLNRVVINIDSEKHSAYTFANLLSGNGELVFRFDQYCDDNVVNLYDTNLDAAGVTASQFNGVVIVENGLLVLDDSDLNSKIKPLVDLQYATNVTALENAMLVAGVGGQVRIGTFGVNATNAEQSALGYTEQRIGSFAIRDNGTAYFEDVNFGSNRALSFVYANNVLDLSGEGTVKALLSDTTTAPTPEDYMVNLYSQSLLVQDDGLSLTQLADGATVVGDAANLTLLVASDIASIAEDDESGSDFTTLPSVVLKLDQIQGAAGISHEVGTAEYGYGLSSVDRFTTTVDSDGQGLFISYQLKKVTINDGESLELVADSGASGTDAAFKAQISGNGGVRIYADKSAEQTITLTNSSNDYVGATEVKTGTLLMGADNVLGNTTELSVASGAGFDAAGYKQTIAGDIAVAGNASLKLSGGELSSETVQAETGSVVDLSGGTLNLNQGGLLAGSVSGTKAVINQNGGKLTVTGDNSALGGGVAIANDAVVEINHLNALGTTAITNNGLLQLNTADGSFANAVSGSGTVELQASTVAVTGGNSGFSGDWIVDDGATLVVSHVQNQLGNYSKMALNGKLDLRLDADALLKAVSGSGDIVKSGDNTLLVDNTVANTGLMHIVQGSLLSSEASAAKIAGSLQLDAAGSAAGFSEIAGNLRNSGTYSISADSKTSAHTLTVGGDYVSDEGVLVFNAVLAGDDNSAQDRVVIKGNASGTGIVYVNNLGGTGELTSTNGITLLEVEGSSALELRQGARIVAGAYDYVLTRDADNRRYCLQSIQAQYPVLPSAPVGALIRPEAGSYMADAKAAQIFEHRLHDRAGAAFYIDPFTGETKENHVWLRQVVEQGHFKMNDRELSTRSMTTATVIGADLVGSTWAENSHYQLGLMGGSMYSRSKTTNIYSPLSSKGHANGAMVGVYGTLFGGSDRPQDALYYVDGWVQWVHSSNKTSSDTLASEKFRSQAWQASVEAAVRLPIYSDKRRDVTIEPQAQVIYEDLNFGPHIETNGTTVEYKGRYNLQSRLGARVQMRYESEKRAVQFFVEGNWIHNTKEVGIAMNTISVMQNSSRNLAEVRAGLEGNITKNVQGWVNVGTRFNAGGSSQNTMNIGVKYSF